MITLQIGKHHLRVHEGHILGTRGHLTANAARLQKKHVLLICHQGLAAISCGKISKCRG